DSVESHLDMAAILGLLNLKGGERNVDSMVESHT
ncbi:MAG: hypothetical protein JWL65_5292, partial [Gammaproteobacteria bacterium]|nr:hypothetical protein [Gammaproteobacteria bacterium]